MAVVGIGIDVVDLARFEASLCRTPQLGARLLCPAELALPIASQAARFAAKEAVAKALGAPSGLAWTDVEVVSDESGRPRLTWRGTVAAEAERQGVRSSHLSLSHDAGVATAMVVLEC